MRGNKLRVDHLFEERKENLVWFKKFPNIVTELEQQNFLFAYFDLEKCVFVVQIGRNHYLGPYNEEEYFEPVFEVNGDSLYYLLPLLEEQVQIMRTEPEKIGKYLEKNVYKKNKKKIV